MEFGGMNYIYVCAGGEEQKVVHTLSLSYT